MLTTSTLGHPTQNNPCIIMLGGEGEGLRWRVQKKAHFIVGVEGFRAGQGGVDSLNVSVAAGLLCDAFMRKPSTDGLSQFPQMRSSKVPFTRSDDQDHPDEPQSQHQDLEPSPNDLNAPTEQASDPIAEAEDLSIELTPHDLDEASISVDKHRLF